MLRHVGIKRFHMRTNPLDESHVGRYDPRMNNYKEHRANGVHLDFGRTGQPLEKTEASPQAGRPGRIA
ncbi:hypothetical protein PsorP6_003225 [Peronosclerospora sorghi]|uniref:Uncharacterized protein n=1 Tax=Peronosclerospora sorghi TaxID=230839 RepID=A0ACC0VT85_9STRA|nr:hypothetical protein PsorP6_003225 [Peronosclerospora sorghi]